MSNSKFSKASEMKHNINIALFITFASLTGCSTSPTYFPTPDPGSINERCPSRPANETYEDVQADDQTIGCYDQYGNDLNEYKKKIIEKNSQIIGDTYFTPPQQQ